jgi:hypothetical protein
LDELDLGGTLQLLSSPPFAAAEKQSGTMDETNTSYGGGTGRSSIFYS